MHYFLSFWIFCLFRIISNEIHFPLYASNFIYQHFPKFSLSSELISEKPLLLGNFSYSTIEISSN